MTDFLCPTCGPIDEDDGLLTGPGDAVCCAFCGCGPDGGLTPLREAYEALVRERNALQAPQGQGEAVAEVLPSFVGVDLGWCNPWNKPPVGTKLYAHPPAPAAVPEHPLFESAEALALWLEDLHATTPDGAVCANKWEPAQIAARAVRGQSYPPAPAAVPDIIDQLADDMYAAEPDPNDTDYMWDTNDCRDWLKEQAQKMRAAPAPAEPDHDLYEDGDSDAPDVIKDRNGDIALGMCRRCGRAEADLAAPCAPAEPETVDDQQAALFNAHNGAED